MVYMYIIIYFRLRFSIVNHRLIWGTSMTVGSSDPPSGAVLVGTSIFQTLLLGETVFQQCYEVKTKPWQKC